MAASVRDNFKANFARILDERGVNQRELAKQLDVDPAVITFWKKGHRYPETAQLDRIIDVLKLRPEELFVSPKRARLLKAEASFLAAAEEVIAAAKDLKTDD